MSRKARRELGDQTGYLTAINRTGDARDERRNRPLFRVIRNSYFIANCAGINELNVALHWLLLVFVVV